MNCMTSLRALTLLTPLLACTGCAQDRPLRGDAPGKVDEFFTELIYRDSLGPFEFPRRDASPGAGYIEWLPEEEAVRAVDDVFRLRMMKPDPEEPDFHRNPEEFVRMKRYIREGLAGVFRWWGGGLNEGAFFYGFCRYFPEGAFENEEPRLTYFYRITQIPINPNLDYPYVDVDGGMNLESWLKGDEQCGY